MHTSAAEKFGSFLTILLIFGLILALAVYISWYILIVFCSVGVLIGLVYALIIYLRSFASAIRLTKTYSPQRTGWLFVLIEKMFYVSKEAAKISLSDNLAIAKNALTRSRSHKFLSFSKWMWLAAACSVVLFGFILILSVILLQFLLVLGILLFLLLIILSLCVLYVLLSALSNIYGAVKIIITGAKKIYQNSGRKSISRMDIKQLFRAYRWFFCFTGGLFIQSWKEYHYQVKINFNAASRRPLYSLTKWIETLSPIFLFFWMSIFLALTIIILVVLALLLFIPLFLFSCLIQIKG